MADKAYQIKVDGWKTDKNWIVCPNHSTRRDISSVRPIDGKTLGNNSVVSFVEIQEHRDYHEQLALPRIPCRGIDCTYSLSAGFWWRTVRKPCNCNRCHGRVGVTYVRAFSN